LGVIGTPAYSLENAWTAFDAFSCCPMPNLRSRAIRAHLPIRWFTRLGHFTSTAPVSACRHLTRRSRPPTDLAARNGQARDQGSSRCRRAEHQFRPHLRAASSKCGGALSNCRTMCRDEARSHCAALVRTRPLGRNDALLSPRTFRPRSAPLRLRRCLPPEPYACVPESQLPR
jgi:hypothetical protein